MTEHKSAENEFSFEGQIMEVGLSAETGQHEVLVKVSGGYTVTIRGFPTAMAKAYARNIYEMVRFSAEVLT